MAQDIKGRAVTQLDAAKQEEATLLEKLKDVRAEIRVLSHLLNGKGKTPKKRGRPRVDEEKLNEAILMACSVTQVISGPRLIELVAIKTGLSNSKIYKALADLRNQGKVSVEKQGRQSLYRLIEQ